MMFAGADINGGLSRSTCEGGTVGVIIFYSFRISGIFCFGIYVYFVLILVPLYSIFKRVVLIYYTYIKSNKRNKKYYF